MPEPSIFSAFLVGLLGGVHCVGMCGGIVAALSFATPNAKPNLAMLLGYNGGRPFKLRSGGSDRRRSGREGSAYGSARSLSAV